MKTIITNDYEDMSEKAAQIIIFKSFTNCLLNSIVSASLIITSNNLI